MAKNGWDVLESTIISIHQIKNHPDNIRKAYDDEDIGNLADSIRSIGLLQPLTLVPAPGHEEDLDSFYVVAGNRRLLAARRAHLSEVRCTIILGMSKLEQVEMMLAENMQRKDLTPFEEGEAFQMLLDLGQSEDDIAGRTGLSKTTIRHRVEIAKLDREAAMKRLSGDNGEFFQLTIGDLQKLEQIGDTETRNRILREAKSSERLAYLVAEEKRRVSRDRSLLEAQGTIKDVKKASAELLNSGRLKVTARIPYGGKSFAKELERAIGEASREGNVRYRETYDGITVFAETRREQPVKKEREETAAERLRREEAKKSGDLTSQIRDMVAHMRAMVLDVVFGRLAQSRLPAEAEAMRLLEGCFKIGIREGTLLSYRSALAFLKGVSMGGKTASARDDEMEDVKALPPCKQALLCVGYLIDDAEAGGGLYGYGRKYERFRMRPLTDLVSLLSPYGCSLTDEEMLLAWGRSELYSNPEKPGDMDEEDDDPGLWRNRK